MLRVDWERRAWVVPAAIAIAANLVFLGTIDGGFPLDDRMQVERNVSIRGLAALPGIFRQATWPGYVYRPVPTLTYALTHAAVGLDPWLYHVTNVLLHALVSVLAYLCLRRVFSGAVAGTAALLFAVHPAHVEVVASIANRTETLAAVGGLVALLLVLPPSDGRARPPLDTFLRVLLSALSFFVAWLAKESTATFFLLLPLVVLVRKENLPGDRSRWARLPREALPGMVALSLATVAYFAARSFVLARMFAGAPVEPIDNWLVTLPLVGRIAHAFALLGRYVAILLVPRGLSADYSWGTTGVTEDLGAPDSLLYAALACGVVAITIVGVLRPSRACLFVGGWFLASFAITSNLLFPIGVVFADRLAYLPSLAVCALLSLLVARVASGVMRGFLIASLALAFSVSTVSYGEVWHDNASLYAYQLQTSPGSAWVHHGLGMELLEQGAPGEARPHFLAALRIYPDHTPAAHGVALVALAEGDHAEARVWLDRALRIDPSFAPGLTTLGALELEAGRTDDAGRLFVRALNVDGGHLDARVGLLAATLRRGNLGQATAMRDDLLQRDPTRADLRALSQSLDLQLEAARGPRRGRRDHPNASALRTSQSG